MKVLVLISVMVFSAAVWADKSAVDEKINQLEQNSINSAKNADKYKANLTRSKSNLNKVQASLSDLKQAQRKIAKSRKTLNNEGGELVAVTSKLQGFKQSEQAKLTKDQETLARLQKLQQELEANIERRQANIDVYQARIEELSASNGKWSVQKQQLDELDQDIASKIKLATQEEQRWQTKVADYSKQVKSWEKRSKDAHQKHLEFKELAN